MLKVILLAITGVLANNITGYYENGLGSSMQLTCTGTAAAAELSGFFFSSDRAAKGGYAISGKATTCDARAQLAFSVAWSNTLSGNELSATSWVAQALDTSPLSLSAMWINVGVLRESMAIGSDLFTQ